MKCPANKDWFRIFLYIGNYCLSEITLTLSVLQQHIINHKSVQFLQRAQNTITRTLTGASRNKSPQPTPCITSVFWHCSCLLSSSPCAVECVCTCNIFLCVVFLPYSWHSCSLSACSSRPNWIILSVAAWFPPQSCLLWLQTSSGGETHTNAL